MVDHSCHADGCTRNVPPRMLMCLRHWKMVPKALQEEVWRTYRPGQERDKRPSREYLAAAKAAIDAVAAKEGRKKMALPADLKQTWGPLLKAAWLSDMANNAMAKGDHVVVGQFTAAERELVDQAHAAAKAAVDLDHRGDIEGAAGQIAESEETCRRLGTALVDRLGVRLGVPAVVFPHDRTNFYMPREHALALGVPFTERQTYVHAVEVSHGV